MHDHRGRFAERDLHRLAIHVDVGGVHDALAGDDFQELVERATRDARRRAGDAQAQHRARLRLVERRAVGIVVGLRLVLEQRRERQETMRWHSDVGAFDRAAARALQARDMPIVEDFDGLDGHQKIALLVELLPGFVEDLHVQQQPAGGGVAGAEGPEAVQQVASVRFTHRVIPRGPMTAATSMLGSGP